MRNKIISTTMQIESKCSDGKHSVSYVENCSINVQVFQNSTHSDMYLTKISPHKLKTNMIN